MLKPWTTFQISRVLKKKSGVDGVGRKAVEHRKKSSTVALYTVCANRGISLFDSGLTKICDIKLPNMEDKDLRLGSGKQNGCKCRARRFVSQHAPLLGIPEAVKNAESCTSCQVQLLRS
jgi:hypothetical protein